MDVRQRELEGNGSVGFKLTSDNSGPMVRVYFVEAVPAAVLSRKDFPSTLSEDCPLSIDRIELFVIPRHWPQPLPRIQVI